ncbi:MAG: class I SAM-dependent methyltransferase [Azoarcus sp.]|nr:class I SAM-dependent methyltransferase [Azoarcus sp.]
MHSTPIEILDVGTGSGGIAHYFASHPDLKCNVASVDTTDNRKIFDGFDFQQVSDTHLPFPDESFDVVLSNHVIEHVGKIAEQKHHLSELKRVLRRDGMIYLAVPNRWMLVEPHYQLAFLSCLPTPWRTPYLRWRGKGNFYDCEPLSLKQLQQFLEEGQFNYRNVSVEAMRRFFDIEKPHSIACKLLRQCPDVLLTPLRSLIPTLVYILTKPR